MKDKILKTHTYYFREDRGGECLQLTTQFIGNGDRITKDDGIYLNQKLTLNSYGNSASFELIGTTLTPETLRELANQLEKVRNQLVK